MPEQAFDAYYKWLAIPPSEQPPNCYRLLGVAIYESDPDVIEAAADQRMAHIRTYQTGKHGAISQKLLNELADARLTLLNLAKKAEYDARLRSQMVAAAVPAEPIRVATPVLAVAPLRSAPRRRRPNYVAMAGIVSAACLIALAAVYAVVSNRSSTKRKVAAPLMNAQKARSPRQVAAKPEPSPAPSVVMPPKPSVKPLRILDRKAETYHQDGLDVATVENGSFHVSTGGDVGEAAVGYELDGAPRLPIEVKVTGSLHPYDENSFAGFMVDYHTPTGYVSRIALGLGLYNDRRTSGGPAWGKQAAPERFIDLSGSELKDLDLQQWAPAEWDRRVWFSVILQNSGAATSVEGRLVLPNNEEEKPAGPDRATNGSRELSLP